MAEPSQPMLRGPDGIAVSVEPYGPDEDQVEGLKRGLESEALSKALWGARFRWISFRLDNDDIRAGGIPDGPSSFRGVVYDYTNRRTIDVAGRLDRPDDARMAFSGRQPIPVRDELEEAVRILEAHGEIGAALRRGLVRAYQPMPPLVDAPRPDGLSERVIAVGLTTTDDLLEGQGVLGGRRHQVVGVDLMSEQVTIPANAPTGAEADLDCGAPVDDSCGSTGQTGQAVVTVRRGGRELWRMLVIRPAASSGTNGSGVELRHVSYLGRSVLRRAHVPILNVEYQGATLSCGPAFRDWLFQETCFRADGTDVAPGFRMCETRPQTILESRTDTGNFRGVALHMDGSDLILTSELRAGWYRYITEWRLRPDGSIRPRMGFAAVTNFCTCQHHIHHAYWRFDWAIEEDTDHRVEELNDLPLAGEQWTTLLVESSRPRDEQVRRRWRVSHRASGRGYLIFPGPHDGEADLYGAGDTWYLRRNDNEIDDGQGFTRDRIRSRARLDLFANGEWIDGEDIVSWYAAHWDHAPGISGDYLGPELIPSPPHAGGGRGRPPYALSAEEG